MSAASRRFHLITVDHSPHRFTDVRGETTFLVFTSAYQAYLFIREYLERREPLLSISNDRMHDIARSLAEGEYSLVRCDTMAVSTLALGIGAEYLIMDPRPGEPERLLPVPQPGE